MNVSIKQPIFVEEKSVVRFYFWYLYQNSDSPKCPKHAIEFASAQDAGHLFYVEASLISSTNV